MLILKEVMQQICTQKPPNYQLKALKNNFVIIKKIETHMEC